MKYEKESKLPACEGACYTWALEPPEWQTALLVQMLPPDLQAGLGKVRALSLKSFHFSPPCTKLACLPKDILFAVCTPSCLYITWLWKSHLASFKALYSSRATVKANGYKPTWKLRSLFEVFFWDKAINLTGEVSFFFKMHRSNLQFNPDCVVAAKSRWTAKTNTNKKFLWATWQN